MLALEKTRRSLAENIEETLPDPCLVADRAGNIIYANPACACLCHRTPKELVGTNVFGYVPTESLAYTLKTGQALQGKRQKLYGGPREVLVNAYPLLHEGEVKGAVSFLREVGRASGTAGAQDAVAKEEELLEARLALLEEIAEKPVFFVGQNRAMREAVAAARRAAAIGRPLLLQGEAGSGKTLLAQTLHELSRRTKGPLVFLPCADLVSQTAEAELLHAFSLAGEGTVVLEEVGRLWPILQSRLISFHAQEGGCFGPGDRHHKRRPRRPGRAGRVPAGPLPLLPGTKRHSAAPAGVPRGPAGSCSTPA